MASVVKDSKNRSPFWICCYTDASGRRLKKSTKHTNKKKATEFCLALEHGEELARNGALSEARLRKLLEDTFERTSGVPVHNYSATAWFNEWRAQKAESRSEATAERYRQVARDFLASLGTRADRPLEQITVQDIRAYRKAELAAGKSNNTANQSGKIISTAFNRAVRLGKIKLNPCHALDQLPEETAERSTFTLEQIRKLIRVATTHDWKIAILFGFYTGARLSDIANLRWSAINFEDRLVSFVPRKTKRAKKILVMPLHPNLEAELVKRRGLPLAFVFPSLAGRGTGGAHGLSAGFAAIMERAEIRPRIIRHTEGGAQTKRKVFTAFGTVLIPRWQTRALVGNCAKRSQVIHPGKRTSFIRIANWNHCARRSPHSRAYDGAIRQD